MCTYRKNRRSLPGALTAVAALMFGAGATEAQSAGAPLSVPGPISIAVAKDVVMWTHREGPRASLYAATAPEYRPSRLSATVLADPESVPTSAGALSPDGSWILYLRDGLLYRIPATAGGVSSARIEESPLFETIGMVTHAVWSPDGSRIAFVMAAPRARQSSEEAAAVPSFVGVFDLKTGSRWFLTPSLGRDGSPVWSLDGGEIFFQRKAMATEWFATAGIRSGSAATRLAAASALPASSLMVGEVESGEVRTLWSDAGDEVVLIGAGGSPASSADPIEYPVAPPLATRSRR